MPTEQRVRTHEEGRPARPAQQPAGRGQEQSVRLLQPRPRELAAQNGQLMSEHYDLKLLELTRAKTQRRNRKRAPKQQIHERDQQGAPPPDREREARLYGPWTPPLHAQPTPTDLRTPHGQGTEGRHDDRLIRQRRKG